MITSGERDGLLEVNAAVEKYVRGVVDPGEVTWDSARAVAAGLSRDAMNAAAIAWIRDSMKGSVRSANLDTERAASVKTAAAQEWRNAQERRRDDLYLGKYRHGGTSQRDGAVPRGCECNYCNEVRDIEAEYAARKMAAISDALAEFERNLRVEWTLELLDSSFSIGDGRTVTWREATVQDHESRISMLSANASANLEAAARHRSAIREIEGARAVSLGDAIHTAAA